MLKYLVFFPLFKERNIKLPLNKSKILLLWIKTLPHEPIADKLKFR